MATFDEVISANRRDSVLVLIMLLSIVGLMIGGTAYYSGCQPKETLLYSAGGMAITGLYGLLAWYKGGAMLLYAIGAERCNKFTQPVLINVVEEICIATGLPMPAVYVIKEETMNAFATGRSPETAAVGVTLGLLENLKRDELLAVMAHEMTHVANYDIRFSMLIATTVGAILLLRDVILRALIDGRRLGRSSSRNGGKGGLLTILLFLAFLVLVPFFSRLLQMFSSHSREYMADIGAVKITRNPGAMISALQRIDKVGGYMFSVNSKASDHIFFADPKVDLSFPGNARSRFLSSHPPISERIAAIKHIYGIR